MTFLHLPSDFAKQLGQGSERLAISRNAKVTQAHVRVSEKPKGVVLRPPNPCGRPDLRSFFLLSRAKRAETDPGGPPSPDDRTSAITALT